MEYMISVQEQADMYGSDNSNINAVVPIDWDIATEGLPTDSLSVKVNGILMDQLEYAFDNDLYTSIKWLLKVKLWATITQSETSE